MSLLYKFASLLLAVFPKRWNNRDTQGAVLLIIVVSLAIASSWALFGCYGYTAFAEYEHHSSAPDTDDLNTTDHLGGCVEYPLADSKYATEMAICLHKEMHRPVFGHDPVATVRIRQPIYRSRQ